MPKLLDARKEKFCLEYALTDNGSQSAISAGYSPNGAAVQASRMLNDANIKLRIAEIRAPIADDCIASIQEIKKYWTERMRDENESTLNRNRSSELLAKSQNMFIEQVEHSGELVIFNSKIDLED